MLAHALTELGPPVHSGNSAEAHPLQGWEEARKLHYTNHRNSITDSPTLFKTINKE